MGSRLVFALVTALLLVLSFSSLNATTITVRQGGGGDYTTVFDAVAASAPGDTVDIGPGTYVEPSIGVDHTLVFESSDGPAATILDGREGGVIIKFRAGSQGCHVRGLTFTGGNRTLTSISALGVSGGSQVVVEDCVFRENGCAGLGVGTGCVVTVLDCEFRNNTEASHGTGGAYFSGEGTIASVHGCKFENNRSRYSGGALLSVLGAAVKVTECEFSNNNSGTGGAVSVGQLSTADFANCLFVGNTGIGGAMYWYKSSGNVENNTFYNNTAMTGPNGAVLIHYAGGVAVARNIFAGTISGYGIYLKGSRPALSCNVYWNNADGPVRGASLDPTSIVADPVFCNPDAGDFTVSSLGAAAPDNSPCGQLVGAFPVACDGGPPPDVTRLLVRQDGSGDYTTVFDAVVASTPGDTIDIGPGTYTDPPMWVGRTLVFESRDGAAATILDGQAGGMILRFIAAAQDCRVEGLTFTGGYRTESTIQALSVSQGSEAIIEDCIFTGNDCISLSVGSNSEGTVLGCEFHDNDAAISGPAGAYFAGFGAVGLVQDCTFEGNYSVDGGAALWSIDGATVTISRCTFENNTTPGWGGAVKVGEEAFAHVSNCLFTGNQGHGGAMYWYGSSGSIQKNTFYGNTAGTGTDAAVLLRKTLVVTVIRNIFANTASGYGLYVLDATSTRLCNVYWENSDGPVGGAPLDPTSVVADPVFCDAAGGDFTVSSLGAAAPANSPCGELVGAFPVGCTIEPPGPLTDAPVILAITDVPDDEGLQVRIKWARSAQDAAGTEHTITGYGIYRYQGPVAASAFAALAPPPGTREKGAAVDGWDYVTTVPARGDSVYQTVVPTLCDSTRHNPCRSAFFVSAMTPNPLVYFDSEPDTGYSTDDTPPAPPHALTVVYEPAGASLQWDTPESPDVEGYRVYRGASAHFEVGSGNLIAETSKTTFDDGGTTAVYFYKVTTLDDGGNESEPASASGTPVFAAGPAKAFALHQNFPNPFKPSTMVPYTVGPGGGHVTLRVYDVAGRLVATLVDEYQDNGHRVAQWNGVSDAGERVASGMYFYRLTAPGFTKTLKMTLIQ